MTTPDPAHVAAITKLLADRSPRSAATIGKETGIGLNATWWALGSSPTFVLTGVREQHSSVRGGGSVDQELWTLRPATTPD